MRFTAQLLLICSFIFGYDLCASIAYPSAHICDQTDVYHGITVADPYRWMEDTDSHQTKEWIEAENKLTFDYLASIEQRSQIKERLTEIWNYETYFWAQKVGGLYFFAKNDGLQNQKVIYKTSSLTGESTVFFDPNKLSTDGTTALGGSAFSPDGKLWAYGLAVAGSDRMEWRIKDVATGNDLPDILPPNRQGEISWMKDSSGFFYSAFPQTREGGELRETTYFHKLYFHKLGTPQSDDVVVYERPDNKEYVISGQVSEDGKWLVISVGKGTERMNMVYVKDLVRKDEPIVPLVTNLKNAYAFVGNNGDRLYFQTDLDAPRNRLASVNIRKPNLWTNVVRESSDTLESTSFINNQFVLSYMKDAYSQIKIYSRKGRFVRDVQLPGIGSADGFGGKRSDTQTFYSFESFNVPTTLFHYDMRNGKSTVFRQSKTTFDPSAFEVKQVFYFSKDKTRVPMFIVHKKGLKLDSNNPTLLRGYGGFNIPITPAFSPARIAWMEMGGVFAVANIRGGSEYGKKWWEGGSRLNKQNVFDDFIAAGEWLIDNKYTQTKKLAIEGRSNGGLLIGAVLNQRPDLFGAAIASVGVMDMLRFDKFTIGYMWKSDYGSTDDLADFKAMYAYSPYHNVHKGAHYPATLITTADHDDRVFPAHSFKYAAAIQAAQSGDAPLLIRIETKAGHGAGKSTSKVIEETADMYAFLAKNLCMGDG